MALAMSRPVKHPKTGIYWLRRRVPDELRSLVGKSEEKKSLGTRDPEEAKRLHAIALVELDARWAGLRRGPQQISKREAHKLAQEVYESWLARHRENPSVKTEWHLNAASQWDSGWPSLPSSNPFAASIQKLCRDQAQKLLHDRGLVVDGDSFAKLAMAVARALDAATQELHKVAGSLTFAPPPPTSRLPDSTRTNKQSAALSFDVVFDGWAQERKPKLANRGPNFGAVPSVDAGSGRKPFRGGRGHAVGLNDVSSK
jgi:hypothetical protein